MTRKEARVYAELAASNFYEYPDLAHKLAVRALKAYPFESLAKGVLHGLELEQKDNARTPYPEPEQPRED